MNKKDKLKINEIFNKEIELLTSICGEIALDSCYESKDFKKKSQESINDIYWEVIKLCEIRDSILGDENE